MPVLKRHFTSPKTAFSLFNIYEKNSVSRTQEFLTFSTLITAVNVLMVLYSTDFCRRNNGRLEKSA
jgi:hypothetical protein